MSNDYYSEYINKANNFKRLFIPGVKIKRKSSKVIWTIIGTTTQAYNTLAIIQSSSGLTKKIFCGQVDLYEIVYIPPAIKVLFNEKESI